MASCHVSRHAVFFLKLGEAPTEIISYRVLLMVSILYCVWAKIRVRQFDKCASEWTLDGMHAAAPGTGAEDASMILAVRLEHAISKAYALAGGCTDLRQAFDRIWRQHIYPIVSIAGAPRAVHLVDAMFQGSIIIHNSYSTGCGRERRRMRSIPQGGSVVEIRSQPISSTTPLRYRARTRPPRAHSGIELQRSA